MTPTLIAMAILLGVPAYLLLGLLYGLSPAGRASFQKRHRFLLEATDGFIANRGGEPHWMGAISGTTMSGHRLEVESDYTNDQTRGITIAISGFDHQGFTFRPRSGVNRTVAQPAMRTGNPATDEAITLGGDLDYALATLSDEATRLLVRLTQQGPLTLTPHKLTLVLPKSARSMEAVRDAIRDALRLSYLLFRDVSVQEGIADRLAWDKDPEAIAIALSRLVAISRHTFIDEHVAPLVPSAFTPTDAAAAVTRSAGSDVVAAWWLGAHGDAEEVLPLVEALSKLKVNAPQTSVLREALARLQSRLPEHGAGRLSISETSSPQGQLSVADGDGEQGGLSLSDDT